MSELQPLPQFTFMPPALPSTDIGDMGELKWLPLSALAIDPAYQRAILDSGKANIRRMIEGFSWLLFGVLVVARRGGRQFAIIDGQHRATAALLHGGIDEVPCLVLRGGQEAEARAFSAINGNVTRIHALQSFRASVAAGDGEARRLVLLCRKGGVAIAPYPKAELAPGETLALGTLRVCARRYGEDVLVAALTLLRAADREAGLGAGAIMGMADVLFHSPAWAARAAELGPVLTARGGGLAALAVKARARKAARGGTEWASFAAIARERLTFAEHNAGVDLRRLMAGR
jgi:hypothetical protein